LDNNNLFSDFNKDYYKIIIEDNLFMCT